MAGALAEQGCNLEEVVAAAQQVADNLGEYVYQRHECNILTPRSL